MIGDGVCFLTIMLGRVLTLQQPPTSCQTGGPGRHSMAPQIVAQNGEELGQFPGAGNGATGVGAKHGKPRRILGLNGF